MKTALRLLVTTVGLAFFNLSVIVVQAQDYSYTTNDGAITITGCSGPGGRYGETGQTGQPEKSG